MTVNHHVAAVLLLFLLPSAAGQAATANAPPPFNFNLGPAFNPTMAIVMIVLVSAFFSLGFFSVYMRRCAERRMHGGGGGAADGPLLFGGGRRSWRAARGVGDEVIRTFPTFRYSAVKGLKIGKGSLECAVCLNEFEDDETLRLLPKCSHVFHSDCIDAWLSSHSTCPVCRANLVPKPGENLSSAAVQILDRDVEPVEPDRELNIQSQSPGPVLRSPEVNMVCPSPRALTNQNRPPRTKSSGLRFAGLFSRSHSTGHSLVQPGENCERYTLRLPEEVRSQILISSLNRTRSLGVLPRARSDRRGYRSGKSYSQYERFDREIRQDRWGFSRTPPFISRTGSVQSRGSEEAMVTRTPPRSLLRSFKTPVDRLFLGSDDIGERSSDRLRPDSQV